MGDRAHRRPIGDDLDHSSRCSCRWNLGSRGYFESCDWGQGGGGMDVREEPRNGEGLWGRGRHRWVKGRRGVTPAKRHTTHGHGMLFWFILLLVQVGSAGGMTVLWPGGLTRLSPVTVPQGGGVLLGFSGEYSQGKTLKQVHPPPLS